MLPNARKCAVLCGFAGTSIVHFYFLVFDFSYPFRAYFGLQICAIRIFMRTFAHTANATGRLNTLIGIFVAFFSSLLLHLQN